MDIAFLKQIDDAIIETTNQYFSYHVSNLVK